MTVFHGPFSRLLSTLVCSSSRILLPHQSAGFDLEHPHADHDAGARVVYDSDVHDLPVGGGPVDDPAPGRPQDVERGCSEQLVGAGKLAYAEALRDAGCENGKRETGNGKRGGNGRRGRWTR